MSLVILTERSGGTFRSTPEASAGCKAEGAEVKDLALGLRHMLCEILHIRSE